jgi:hypothetical protein
VLDVMPAGPFARYWTIVGDDIYYLDTTNPRQPLVSALDLSTHRVRSIRQLPGLPCPFISPDLAVSPDGRTVLTCFEGPREADIVLVDDFR